MNTNKVFLDTEFTGLVKDTDIISIGLYIDEENYFYAEFNDWDKSKSFEWLETTVVSKLEYLDLDTYLSKNKQCYRVKASKNEVAIELKAWFANYGSVEIWADVLAYDWILFCDLFGGAMGIPDNIFYAPFDISTVFRLKNIIVPTGGKYGGDILRYEFVGKANTHQHHALEDAKVEFLCYQKLMKNDTK